MKEFLVFENMIFLFLSNTFTHTNMMNLAFLQTTQSAMLYTSRGLSRYGPVAKETVELSK